MVYITCISCYITCHIVWYILFILMSEHVSPWLPQWLTAWHRKAQCQCLTSCNVTNKLFDTSFSWNTQSIWQYAVLESMELWVRFPVCAIGFWNFCVMPYLVYTMVYTSMVYHSYIWYITHQYNLVYIMVYHISWYITCVISHMRYITWYITWYIGLIYHMLYVMVYIMVYNMSYIIHGMVYTVSI
jgi:hypothetical protein